MILRKKQMADMAHVVMERTSNPNVSAIRDDVTYDVAKLNENGCDIDAIIVSRKEVHYSNILEKDIMYKHNVKITIEESWEEI